MMKTDLALLFCVVACCLNAPVLGRYYDPEIESKIHDLLQLLAQDNADANTLAWKRSVPSGLRLREEKSVQHARNTQRAKNLGYDDIFSPVPAELPYNGKEHEAYGIRSVEKPQVKVETVERPGA